MSIEHRVGDVLFIIPKSKMTIIPVQVVERSTKEVIGDSPTAISYFCKLPNDDKLYDLSKINGVLYNTLQSAQTSLMANAQKIVATAIGKAAKIAEKAFGKVDTSVHSDAFTMAAEPADHVQNGAQDTIIELEDGTLAKLKGSST
jgi:hypothetical protein